MTQERCDSCGGRGGNGTFVLRDDPRTGELTRQSQDPCPACGKDYDPGWSIYAEGARSGGPTVRCWGTGAHAYEFFEGDEENLG